MAEPTKNGGSGTQKNYSLIIFLFVVGIIAVGITILFSGLSKMPKAVLVSEILVLGCLVGLLIVAITSKKRMVSQLEQNERYPYANVNKREIENIFSIIADEEKKRRRLDAFAAGVDFQATNAASKSAASAESKSSSDTEPKKSEPVSAQSKSAPAASSDSAVEDDEDRPVIAVLSDEDEEPAEKKVDEVKETAESEKTSAPEEKEQRRRPPQQGEKRGSQGDRRREPARQGQPRKKRPAYDPYYEERYDRYGRPIRRRPDPYAEMYYDEYGNPIRRRPPEVYYDEYGRPIRRRPRDPYAQQGRPPQKRRPPEGAQQGEKKKRPPTEGAPAQQSKSAAPAEETPKKKRAPVDPNAPVEMTPKKQQSRYSEEHVSVIQDYDDYEVDYSRAPSRVPVKKDRPERANTRPAVYEEDEVDRSAPIVIPDDDYDPGYDDDYTPPPAPKRPAAQPAQPHRQEKYVPSYEDEEGVVVVPVFDDSYDDEEPYTPPQRGYSGGAQSGGQGRAPQPVQDDDGPYVPDYSDEEVTVLPRDDEYESYMEQKRAQQRREERRSKGKTALTIRKMRRKKIRRKSRRQKMFRCSVNTLTDYLNSYSSRTRR